MTNEDDAKRARLIVKLADQFAQLKADGKSINESRKAIIDKIEANGLDRKAFKDLCRIREVEEEKRLAYEASRRIIARAFGWPDQPDLFAPTPAEEQPAAGVDSGVAAAVAAGWLDDDADLVDNRDAPDDVDDAAVDVEFLADDAA